MFGLFKRSKIASWEIELLRNVVMKLPKEYENLINQINDGLFKRVIVGVGDIPGYVAFTFHPNVLKRYERDNERDFKFTNIKVYDNISSSFLLYEIYVSSGTISGYSLGGTNKHDININKVDISELRKEFIGESDYNRIANLFTEKEKMLFNPSDVYSIYIGDLEYFHIKDLEDGDFIGVDNKKNVYKITHDPMEVVAINKKVIDALNENSQKEIPEPM